MEKINKYLVRKLLGEFKSWADKDKEKYETFWKAFGYFIKEGIHTDFTNREKLIELYRCESSFEVGTLTSLDDYVQRMGTDQEEIYYVYGKNRVAIENSPTWNTLRRITSKFSTCLTRLMTSSCPPLQPTRKSHWWVSTRRI